MKIVLTAGMRDLFDKTPPILGSTQLPADNNIPPQGPDSNPCGLGDT